MGKHINIKHYKTMEIGNLETTHGNGSTRKTPTVAHSENGSNKISWRMIITYKLEKNGNTVTHTWDDSP